MQILLTKVFVIFILLSIFLIRKNIRAMYLFSKNFGDNLNYFLLKDMIKGKVIFYDRTFRRKNNKYWDRKNIIKQNEIAKIDLFFIGSILDTICNWSYTFQNEKNKYKTIISKWYFKIFDYFYPLIIFGTGFISSQKYQKESYIRNIKVIAVRGNITLQRLKRNGITVPKDVILADPGILAPMLINISAIKITKKYNLCVIPHYIDRNNELLKKNIQVNNSIILNIMENPDKFIEIILKCKNVLSSGLHGLIIADAFGIPNMRMVINNNILGGDYKFKDYYSSYNLELPVKIDLRITIFSDKELKLLEDNHFISKDLIRIKQCQLLSKFPFKLKNKYEKIKKNICF